MGAILCGADLSKARLRGANFVGTDLTGAILPWGLWSKHACATILRASASGAALGARIGVKRWLAASLSWGAVTGFLLGISTGQVAPFALCVLGGLLVGAAAPHLVGGIAGFVGGGIIGARTARKRWHRARTL